MDDDDGSPEPAWAEAQSELSAPLGSEQESRLPSPAATVRFSAGELRCVLGELQWALVVPRSDASDADGLAQFLDPHTDRYFGDKSPVAAGEAGERDFVFHDECVHAFVVARLAVDRVGTASRSVTPEMRSAVFRALLLSLSIKLQCFVGADSDRPEKGTGQDPRGGQGVALPPRQASLSGGPSAGKHALHRKSAQQVSGRPKEAASPSPPQRSASFVSDVPRNSLAAMQPAAVLSLDQRLPLLTPPPAAVTPQNQQPAAATNAVTLRGTNYFFDESWTGKELADAVLVADAAPIAVLPLQVSLAVPEVRDLRYKKAADLVLWVSVQQIAPLVDIEMVSGVSGISEGLSRLVLAEKRDLHADGSTQLAPGDGNGLCDVDVVDSIDLLEPLGECLNAKLAMAGPNTTRRAAARFSSGPSTPMLPPASGTIPTAGGTTLSLSLTRTVPLIPALSTTVALAAATPESFMLVVRIARLAGWQVEAIVDRVETHVSGAQTESISALDAALPAHINAGNELELLYRVVPVLSAVSAPVGSIRGLEEPNENQSPDRLPRGDSTLSLASTASSVSMEAQALHEPIGDGLGTRAVLARVTLAIRTNTPGTRRQSFLNAWSWRVRLDRLLPGLPEVAGDDALAGAAHNWSSSGRYHGHVKPSVEPALPPHLSISFSLKGIAAVKMRQAFGVRVFLMNRTPFTRTLVLAMPNAYRSAHSAGEAGPVSRMADSHRDAGYLGGQHMEGSALYVPDQQLAEAWGDSARHEASMVCLESSLHIPPLAPNSCYETTVHFVAIKGHLHTIDRIRVIDADRRSVTILRRVLQLYAT